MIGFMATQASTSLKKAVLNGMAMAVAMHPPQRNAAAKSQTVLRSRRSMNHNTASGGMARMLESTRALKNTLATSERKLTIKSR